MPPGRDPRPVTSSGEVPPGEVPAAPAEAAEVFGTTPVEVAPEVEREAIEAPSRTTPSATPRPTVTAPVGTTRKGGSKRAPKGGTKRRTRAETRVELEKLIADLEPHEIQVKPLAEELGASRRTVRDLLDEMNARPTETAGTSQ